MRVSFKSFFSCFWRNLISFVKANLLFWLFCLPIITIPVSLTALNTVCADASLGKCDSVWKTYIYALKERFARSLIIGTFYVIWFAISVFGIWFYSNLLNDSQLAIIPMGIAIAFAAVAFATIPYSFVMLGKTNLKIKEILKNAFILLSIEPKMTFISFITCFIFIYVETMLFMKLYSFILVIGITVIVFPGTYFSMYVLQQHIFTETII